MKAQKFLYVAQNVSNAFFRKHNVYKVGHSGNPLYRIDQLGGSGTTDVFRPVLTLPLPIGVKDVHVLEHPLIRPFILKYMDDNNRIKKSFTSLYGVEGIKRRREIVSFGTSFSKKKMIQLFKRVVSSMCTSDLSYKCPSTDCLFHDNNAKYCSVCTKYLRSIYNGYAHLYMHNHLNVSDQTKPSRKRIREELDLSIETFKRSSRQEHKKQKVSKCKPTINSFWVLRTYNHTTGRCMIGIGEVKAIENNNVYTLKWWYPSTEGDYSSKLWTNTPLYTRKSKMDKVKWSHRWLCPINITTSNFIYKKDQSKVMKYHDHVNIPTYTAYFTIK